MQLRYTTIFSASCFLLASLFVGKLLRPKVSNENDTDPRPIIEPFVTAHVPSKLDRRKRKRFYRFTATTPNIAHLPEAFIYHKPPLIPFGEKCGIALHLNNISKTFQWWATQDGVKHPITIITCPQTAVTIMQKIMAHPHVTVGVEGATNFTEFPVQYVQISTPNNEVFIFPTGKCPALFKPIFTLFANTACRKYMFSMWSDIQRLTESAERRLTWPSLNPTTFEHSNCVDVQNIPTICKNRVVKSSGHVFYKYLSSKEHTDMIQTYITLKLYFRDAFKSPTIDVFTQPFLYKELILYLALDVILLNLTIQHIPSSMLVAPPSSDAS